MEGKIKVVFSRAASHNNRLRHKVGNPTSSLKWVFRVRPLSFCKVERTIALQKVVFPYFWALHASPSNHRPATFLFLFLRPAAQGQHSVDMKPTLLKTSEYVNRVAAKMRLREALPTCWAPL